MKFTAFVFLALSVAFLGSGVCEAQQASQQPVEKAPAPAKAAPPPAPAHRSRSFERAPAYEAAPAGAPKSDSGNPDVVVGGLPGAKSATAGEKQP
jgi:hypothetical protein